jgi:hypothetical protein
MYLYGGHFSWWSKLGKSWTEDFKNEESVDGLLNWKRGMLTVERGNNTVCKKRFEYPEKGLIAEGLSQIKQQVDRLGFLRHKFHENMKIWMIVIKSDLVTCKILVVVV